jgi:hypothetical protein
MSGLDFDVPSCTHDDGAGAFAVGQFRSAGGVGNILLSVGLDACCASQQEDQAQSGQSHDEGDELATILVASRIAAASVASVGASSTNETATAPATTAAATRRQLDEGPGNPDGCYDISVHRCDCGVPDAAVCNALNIPGQSQRFFWTAGCGSCAGRDTCGTALASSLPRWFLDAWTFDFQQACAAVGH